jgi:hypothetical protein
MMISHPKSVCETRLDVALKMWLCESSARARDRVRADQHCSVCGAKESEETVGVVNLMVGVSGERRLNVRFNQTLGFGLRSAEAGNQVKEEVGVSGTSG